MKLHRPVIAVVLAAVLGACASAPQATAPAPETTLAAPAAEPASADADAAPTGIEPAGETASVDAATPTGGTATPTGEEQDFAAIYGQDYDPVADPTLPPEAQAPVSYDPWEKLNRKVHVFNNAIDRSVARPLARGYVKVVPQPVRNGVNNFFDNLRSPLGMVNLFLQGRPKQAWDTLGRFLINTTFGIGGVFDLASHDGVPRHDADFGQTLGVWGWRNSRYVELPFFGPRTLRDTLALGADSMLSPAHYIEADRIRYSLQGVQLVDTRAQLLPLDAVRAGAADDYALIRDAWTQRRNYQIQQRLGEKRQQDESLPDYLQDPEEMQDVPANAMPIPVPVTLPDLGGGG